MYQHHTWLNPEVDEAVVVSKADTKPQCHSYSYHDAYHHRCQRRKGRQPGKNELAVDTERVKIKLVV